MHLSYYLLLLVQTWIFTSIPEIFFMYQNYLFGVELD